MKKLILSLSLIATVGTPLIVIGCTKPKSSSKEPAVTKPVTPPVKPPVIDAKASWNQELPKNKIYEKLGGNFTTHFKESKVYDEVLKKSEVSLPEPQSSTDKIFIDDQPIDSITIKPLNGNDKGEFYTIDPTTNKFYTKAYFLAKYPQLTITSLNNFKYKFNNKLYDNFQGVINDPSWKKAAEDLFIEKATAKTFKVNNMIKIPANKWYKQKADGTYKITDNPPKNNNYVKVGNGYLQKANNKWKLTINQSKDWHQRTDGYVNKKTRDFRKVQPNAIDFPYEVNNTNAPIKIDNKTGKEYPEIDFNQFSFVRKPLYSSDSYFFIMNNNFDTSGEYGDQPDWTKIQGINSYFDFTSDPTIYPDAPRFGSNLGNNPVLYLNRSRKLVKKIQDLPNYDVVSQIRAPKDINDKIVVFGAGEAKPVPASAEYYKVTYKNPTSKMNDFAAYFPKTNKGLEDLLKHRWIKDEIIPVTKAKPIFVNQQGIWTNEHDPNRLILSGEIKRESGYVGKSTKNWSAEINDLKLLPTNRYYVNEIKIINGDANKIEYWSEVAESMKGVTIPYSADVLEPTQKNKEGFLEYKNKFYITASDMGTLISFMSSSLDRELLLKSLFEPSDLDDLLSSIGSDNTYLAAVINGKVYNEADKKKEFKKHGIYSKGNTKNAYVYQKNGKDVYVWDHQPKKEDFITIDPQGGWALYDDHFYKFTPAQIQQDQAKVLVNLIWMPAPTAGGYIRGIKWSPRADLVGDYWEAIKPIDSAWVLQSDINQKAGTYKDNQPVDNSYTTTSTDKWIIFDAQNNVGKIINNDPNDPALDFIKVLNQMYWQKKNGAIIAFKDETEAIRKNIVETFKIILKDKTYFLQGDLKTWTIDDLAIKLKWSNPLPQGIYYLAKNKTPKHFTKNATDAHLVMGVDDKVGVAEEVLIKQATANDGIIIDGKKIYLPKINNHFDVI